MTDEEFKRYEKPFVDNVDFRDKGFFEILSNAPKDKLEKIQ